MTTIPSRERHNVRVTPHRRARTALLATLLVPALLLTGCGGGESDKASDQRTPEASAELPQGNVEVPDGVTLTKAGTALKFGEQALVAYEPNTQRARCSR